MSKIIQLLNDKHLLSEDETLVLAEGLDEPVSFDEALLFLDEYIDEITELSNYAPIFIKTI